MEKLYPDAADKGRYWQQGEVKQCKECGQLWMADVPFCPYCNISREARVYYAEQQRKEERSEVS